MSLLVASMAVFKSEDTYENYEEDVSETFAGQWLFEEETEPGCSGNQETTNCRDASIEEIFHVITSSGIGGAYPSDYSDCDDSSLSTMQQEMDIARGGHFDSVPTTYPSDAIYHYYDKTCDYSCQGTELDRVRRMNKVHNSYPELHMESNHLLLLLHRFKR